jgi:ATP-binding cassette subfamily B protein/subfamily B ATP-binding cassette protein MsbA
MSMISQYLRLGGYLHSHRRGLLQILLLTIVGALAASVQPWPLKLLVDYGLTETPPPPIADALLNSLGLGNHPMAWVLLAAAAALVITLLVNLIDLALNWVWAVVGQQLVYDVAADLFDRMNRLSLVLVSRRSVGDALSRLTGDTWCIYTVVEALLVSPLRHLLTLTVITVVALQLDPWLTLWTWAITPLLALTANFYGHRLTTRAYGVRDAESQVMRFVHQTLTAIPVVQTFDAGPWHQREFERRSDGFARSVRDRVVGRRSYMMASGIINAAGIAGVLLIGGHRVLAGAMSLGSLLVFLAYARTIRNSLQKMMNVYGNLKIAEASVERIVSVLDSDDHVIEPSSPRRWPAVSETARGAVSLESVWFGYAADQPVLRGIDLKVEPGQTVALVGPTGAGKSTLVSLLPRLIDPQRGRVMIDGMDLREVSLADVRARIAMVLQEPYLLPMTVAENIAYGRPDAPREQIIDAAQSAEADAFIRALPSGYDTVIGERGQTLSGGQRQRLSIARALLKDASVVILDEPTGALDAQTEASVMQAIGRLTKHRTTFVIAHRLSTVRNADVIVFLDDGRIAESGSHQQLIEHGGRYAQYVRLQYGHGAVEELR